MFDYDGKRFHSLSNSSTGDVGDGTVFEYRQRDDLVWATYSGGGVRFGTLVAVMATDGSLDMRYQHVSEEGVLKTGTCSSSPRQLPDGRLQLEESWQWTSGGEGSGRSTIEEIPGSKP